MGILRRPSHVWMVIRASFGSPIEVSAAPLLYLGDHVKSTHQGIKASRSDIHANLDWRNSEECELELRHPYGSSRNFYWDSSVKIFFRTFWRDVINTESIHAMPFIDLRFLMKSDRPSNSEHVAVDIMS